MLVMLLVMMLLLLVLVMRLVLMLLLVVHDMGARGLLMLMKLVLEAPLLVLVIEGHTLVNLTGFNFIVDVRAMGVRGLSLEVRSLLRKVLGQTGVVASAFRGNVASCQLLRARRQDESPCLPQGYCPDVEEPQEDFGESVWLRTPLVELVLLQGAEVGVVLLLQSLQGLGIAR